MGLDSQLFRTVFVGARYNHRRVKGEIKITVRGQELPVNFKQVWSIKEEVLNWNKNYVVHNWMKANIQDHIDNCAEYSIRPEQLFEFRDMVKEWLACDKAMHEVIDGMYWEMENTLQILEGICKNPEEVGEYTYSSSW